MMQNIFKEPLKIINFAVLLQQQRYIVAISYLFYLQNGLNLSDFLLFQSIFYFTGLIAELPAGYIADIFPRKNVLIFSYLLFMVRIIMWIFVPNYWTILAGEVLYGLSKAFYRGTSDGYIYDYLKTTNATNYMVNKYGKFNFFMSCGSAISCLIGAYLYKYIGFTLLLGIELCCNSIAVFLLLFLPSVAQKKKSKSINRHVCRLCNIVRKAINNPKLNIYMLYGSVLTGVTSVFVWNFQPIMKSFAIPVYIFGIVYFINHILRALCSLKAYKFAEKFSLKQMSLFTWILYVLSFVMIYKVMTFTSKKVCILVLIFICVAIGMQMIFNINNLSRIHSLIPTKSRATISSIQFMLTGLFSGLFLMICKHFAAINSIQTTMLGFLVMFLALIVLVKRIFSQTDNDANCH